MSYLTKLEFVTLDISSKNYLSWILDVDIYLGPMAFRDSIKDVNKASSHNQAKSMIFIHHHQLEELKTEYLT